MITPNGGVFGRNPKFNNVTVEGDLNVSGGMTSTPNDVAPTSNVTIGLDAGANLVADSTGNICIGSGAGDVLGASGRNVAIGTDALGAFSAGAASITNTTPGTGGTAGTYTGVVLEKDSGDGVMAVYPTVTIVVSAGGVVTSVAIASPGSGATVASGIVFRSTTAGVPTNWRGTLATVGGNHIAIGNNALLLATPVVPAGLLNEPTSRIAIGAGALDAVTTGWSEIAIGENALGATTTGNNNIAIGNNAGAAGITAGTCLFIGANAGLNANTSSLMAIGHFAGRAITANAPSCCIVGSNALTSNANTIAPSATVIGHAAFNLSTDVTGCTALGHLAGAYRGATGTTTLAAAENSIFIGRQSRADNTGQTNQVVIGGVDAIGDGSNTTVINNSSTTSTRIAGTATSLFAIAGDTMRITETRTPASNAAGTAGDFTFGTDSGTTYLYYCIASGNWGRVALTTGY
jgi:hypothetical protein